MKPEITIRYGSTSDHVIVDGRPFHLGAMKRPERNKFRRLLVAGLVQAGAFAPTGETK